MQDGAQFPAEYSKEVIYNFLEEHLQIDRPRDKIEFKRVHRLGKPNTDVRLRPIIARFLHYGDKQLVMDRAWKYLKNTAFNVYDDIPSMFIYLFIYLFFFESCIYLFTRK